MPLAKVAQRTKIQLVPGVQEAERHAVLQLAGDLAGRVHPGAVTVQQHLDHHARVIRQVAPPLVVCIHNRRQVQRIHHVIHEAR